MNAIAQRAALFTAGHPTKGEKAGLPCRQEAVAMSVTTPRGGQQAQRNRQRTSLD